MWLAHHGVLGMKWGVRRYQNYDGSLTLAGRKRASMAKNYYKVENSLTNSELRLFSNQNNPNPKAVTKKEAKDFTDLANSHRDTIAFVSKNGNVVIAGKINGNDGSYYDIGWATAIEARGTGITQKNIQEAISMVREFSNEPIKAFIKESNIASIKTAEKAGFKKVSEKDGVATYQYEDKTLFVSGSSHTQTKGDPYYRKQLPKEIKNELEKAMTSNKKIIVGDAPGIDRQVQNYLKSKKYSNVEVYGPGKQVRYSANKNWKTNPIDSGKYKPDTDEWRAEKDIAMSTRANEALAIILENGGAGATRDNVKRMIEQNKDVKIFELSTKGDKFIKEL